MADKLTHQQALAVQNRGGKLLVSAAAGSGKTKVLVDRLLSYITDPQDPANLDDFLIITYTKAAASELRGKIAAKLTERIAEEPENRHLQKQMQRLFLTKISTVHGFCGDLLREYAYRLDLSADFRVGDENECREIRETVVTDLLDRAYTREEQEDFRAFVDSQGLGRDDRLVPILIQKVYDSARCHLDPEKWLNSCLEATDIELVEDASQTLWGRYLMEDLFDYVDAQIRVLRQCAMDLDSSENLEKLADKVWDVVHQLENLRNSETWDDVSRRRSIQFPRFTPPRKNYDVELKDRVKVAWDACKSGLEKKLAVFTEDSAQILQDLENAAPGVRGLVALVREFDKDYQSAKRSRRLLDFSDLEHKTLDLLLGKFRQSPTAAAREIGRRYREIMVDEYQDSNGVQDAIFDALTRENQNCFLVGDVKQSIYQFRLADPGIFLEKYREYVPAEEAQPREGRKVMLSHNFRSGPEIIEGVNDIFSICMSPKVGGLAYGEAEALREGVPRAPLGEAAVELHCIDVREATYPEEAAFVADRIQTMLREGTLVRKDGELRPVQPEDIAILLRSPGSGGGYIQRALEARGIRCASGGGTDLLKTQEIATVISFLQTIQNPRQDIPLISTLASPIFGFTADDLAALRGGKRKISFYDALLECEDPKATAFLDILERLRREARMNTLTGLLETCFRLTRLDSTYASMPGGDAKAANLQTFYKLAADFEKGNLRDLSQFLDHLEALKEDGIPIPGAGNGGCVTIMSIHRSKGLEFPVVFLCNLSRKFNKESLRDQILCDKNLGLGLSAADHENRLRYPTLSKRAIKVKAEKEGISEEMRVLYVALTRARDRLIMTYAAKKLAEDLKEAAMRLDFDGGALQCADAISMGEWVLLAAIQRRDAGALHACGSRPANTFSSQYPWKITVCDAPDEGAAAMAEDAQKQTLPEGLEASLGRALSFRYANLAATQTPSKQTATDRKGRFKDAEAAENTREPKNPQRSWRRPSFLEETVEGKTYGSAIHAALQYIRYENCATEESVSREIARLAEQGFLKEDQGKLVNCRQIARFFQTEIGEKLRTGTPCIREFKFSILDDGCHYGENLEGEQVLLQGVVDCALMEEDGITVLDFKTDYVTEETLAQVAERYRPQVQTYAEALRRIYEQPIKHRYLYFFRIDRFVEVK